MASLTFIKMHGLGNDFVVLDGRTRDPGLRAGQVVAIADRHTGVGCDQLIVLENVVDDRADVFMRVYNQDGGESAACGNATRCISALLTAETGNRAVRVQTAAGVLKTHARDDGRVSVDMGPVRTDWESIPLRHQADTRSLPININGLPRPVAVNVGNPHLVFFVEDAVVAPIDEHGASLEHHPLFPERTNVQMASLPGNGSIRLRTWERGVGRTRASGSSACAVLAAAHICGLVTNRQADVVMDGGVLSVDWREDNHVVQTGPVATAFNGVIDASLLG